MATSPPACTRLAFPHLLKQSFTAVHAQTLDDIPSCALSCLDGAIKENTSCSTTDYACVCENFDSLQGAASSCVIDACSADVAVNEVLPAIQLSAASGSLPQLPLPPIPIHRSVVAAVTMRVQGIFTEPSAEPTLSSARSISAKPSAEPTLSSARSISAEPSVESTLSAATEGSSRALAGIVVGAVAAVLFVLAVMFFWWRKRKARTASQDLTSRHKGNASHLQKTQLEQHGKVEMRVSSPTSPIEMRGSTPPPAVELSSQRRSLPLPAPELDSENQSAIYSGIAASELHGQDRSPYSELPPETVKYEMDSSQQPMPGPWELPAGPVQQQSQNWAAPASPSDSAPDARVSLMPDGLGRPASRSSAELTPFVSQSASLALLMDQYAQLEARRQRILELEMIEREQAELQQHLSKLSGNSGE
ncbi:hypothetical protein ACJZ2D_017091 [Fusarium nematophilum]